MSRSAVTTILLWGGFAALIVGGFWLDWKERQREEAQRRLPPPSYPQAISEGRATWADEMRRIADLNELYEAPAYGEDR